MRIRELIHGANLNVNYGYTYTEVPNRTRQRAWEVAQDQVEVTERQLSNHQAAVQNLRRRLGDLQDAYAGQRHALAGQVVQQRLDLQHRQRKGQATPRIQQRLDRLRRELTSRTERF